MVHENLPLPSQYDSTIHVASWPIHYPPYVTHYIKTAFGNFHVDRKPKYDFNQGYTTYCKIRLRFSAYNPKMGGREGRPLLGNDTDEQG